MKKIKVLNFQSVYGILQVTGLEDTGITKNHNNQNIRMLTMCQACYVLYMYYMYYLFICIPQFMSLKTCPILLILN